MRNLNQNITHWTVQHTFSGLTFGLPTIIGGYWENRRELFLKHTGEEDVSKAVVAIDSVVEVGEYLYLGISSALDPTTLPKASEVKASKNLLNLRGTREERVVFL